MVELQRLPLSVFVSNFLNQQLGPNPFLLRIKGHEVSSINFVWVFEARVIRFPREELGSSTTIILA